MINHFPGMYSICRKDALARAVLRIQKYSNQFDIFPKSWVLPYDYKEFEYALKTKRNVTYIAKPDNGCQGKGKYAHNYL